MAIQTSCECQYWVGQSGTTVTALLTTFVLALQVYDLGTMRDYVKVTVVSKYKSTATAPTLGYHTDSKKM